MGKVTDIKAAVEPCQYCGAKPACEAFSCPRIRRVETDNEGIAVEFWPVMPGELEIEVEPEP